MSESIETVFDGVALRPAAPLTFAPNTRVWIVIETVLPPTPPGSFLRTARSLNVDGPVDWSANLENYLYGDTTRDAE